MVIDLEVEGLSFPIINLTEHIQLHTAMPTRPNPLGSIPGDLISLMEDPQQPYTTPAAPPIAANIFPPCVRQISRMNPPSLNEPPIHRPGLSYSLALRSERDLSISAAPLSPIAETHHFHQPIPSTPNRKTPRPSPQSSYPSTPHISPSPILPPSIVRETPGPDAQAIQAKGYCCQVGFPSLYCGGRGG
ncbi:proline-rich receptor-like protein kinase PERK8 [Magnolia sinica]|uniref:proline-rich receptor-like protein kinase PERK8 n=1 Tax=Magnolia sinica TaxID=86752 RepID=UPI00265B3A48|nr:proline-rich receptor-like protein kinase PERK8 [Magnolia sinica]